MICHHGFDQSHTALEYTHIHIGYYIINLRNFFKFLKKTNYSPKIPCINTPTSSATPSQKKSQF